MVVAQMAERTLPTPEIRGLNPNIGNKIFKRNYLSIAIQKRQKQRKRGREWPNLKKHNMETIKHESSLSKTIAEKLIERLTDPKSHYGVFPTLVKIGSKFTRNF